MLLFGSTSWGSRSTRGDYVWPSIPESGQLAIRLGRTRQILITLLSTLYSIVYLIWWVVVVGSMPVYVEEQAGEDIRLPCWDIFQTPMQKLQFPHLAQNAHMPLASWKGTRLHSCCAHYAASSPGFDSDNVLTCEKCMEMVEEPSVSTLLMHHPRAMVQVGGGRRWGLMQL